MVFDVAGRQSYSLPPEELLWHLCRHCVSLRHHFRMIWAADIVGFSETFLTVIDWKRIQRRYPFVLSTLSLLDCLAPVPDSVLRKAGVRRGGTPKGIGDDYFGWPWERARKWDSLPGRLELLTRTFTPPEWWLRLNYGTGTGRFGGARARGRHGAALIRHGIRLVQEARAFARERRANRTF